MKPYLRDFASLASFGLELIITTDEHSLFRLTDDISTFQSYIPPKKFVQRFFDNKVEPSDSERDAFVSFVDDLLALERKQFLVAMRAIKTYVAALHSIPADLGLSYTLFVSAVETMVEGPYRSQVSWADVDTETQEAIDVALECASEETAIAVRKACLKLVKPKSSLSRRYRDFIVDKIDRDYYRTPRTVSNFPVTSRELPKVLRNAYNLRSKYIHSAAPLPGELLFPCNYSEVSYVARDPVLTVQGLARITRHVIWRFVKEGKKVKTEKGYNYLAERTGVVTQETSPRNWVGMPLQHPQHGIKRLEGFLTLVAESESDNDFSRSPDLRKILGDIERIFIQAKSTYKPALYVLYVVAYNAILPNINQSPKREVFIQENAKIGEEPSGEFFIGHILPGLSTDWLLETHQQAYDRYWKERENRDRLHAPRLFEAAATLALAERYRLDGDMDKTKSLVSDAVECHPGHVYVQEIEANLESDKIINWREVLSKKQRDPLNFWWLPR